MKSKTERNEETNIGKDIKDLFEALNRKTGWQSWIIISDKIYFKKSSSTDLEYDFSIIGKFATNLRNNIDKGRPRLGNLVLLEWNILYFLV